MERTEMHGQSRLQKRGAVYYFRAMIPKDLYVHYGRKEIIYSLKTKDLREAKLLTRRDSARLDDEFEARRDQRPPQQSRRISTLDEPMIRGLCELWRHECLSTDVWHRAQGLSDAEFDDAKAQRAETLAALRDILAKGRLEKITPALNQFLHFINLDFVGPPEGLRKLAWTFLQAAIESHEAVMRRDLGEVVPTPPAPRAIVPQTSASIPSDSGGEPTFTECFAIWETIVTDRPSKTVADFRAVMNDFTNWAGMLPVSQYTSDDAYGYVDYLRKRDGLDSATVEKKLTYLRAIYNAAKSRRRDLPENPFSKVQVAQDRVKRAKRLPYDHADRQLIFSAPIYIGGRRERGGAGEAAVWLPLLALYTGARLEELGQLLVTDVRKEQGIDYLSISDLNEDSSIGESGKRLKNAESRRILPIHPELIRLGFLNYVENLRVKDITQLFPDLKRDCHFKRTGNWSKWWSRYRRKVIGIQGRLKPFHSFRHTFRDACREAELSEEVADALMGHASSDKTGRGYGSGFSLRVLHRAICNIRYPGLQIPVLVADTDNAVVKGND